MAITRRQVGAAIKREIGPFLAQRGYREADDLEFVNTVQDCQKIVSFILLKRPDSVRVQLGVRTRFPRVQEFLDAPSRERDPWRGTYGGLIHLIARSDYLEWKVLEPVDVAALLMDVRALLQDHGFPFLNEFCDIKRLKHELEAGDPRYGLECDPEERICLLAAIDASEGNVAGAVERLEKYVEANSEKRMKWWIRAKEMRDRLAELL